MAKFIIIKILSLISVSIVLYILNLGFFHLKSRNLRICRFFVANTYIVPFDKILRNPDGSAITHIGPSFISTNPKGVTYNNAKGQKPYSFNYNSQDYYISTQLRDKDAKCNMWAFREYVNRTEPSFQIAVI